MRKLSGLGSKASTLQPWLAIDDNINNGTFFVQDLVHIATKLRNFLINASFNGKILPIGKYEISLSHLHQLLKLFSKDKHQLTPTTLNPCDKQNFKSVLRMCSSDVINLLRDNVANSRGTIQYLQIIRDVIDCYMNSNLTPIQRIRKAWYPLFLIRIWRDFILSQKNYSLKNNFLTSNCYSCIELNAQSLILCMSHLREIGKPELFVPLSDLFGSQPCEAIFRQLRSFTTTYSTVTNCTVKEATSRISKIHFQNQITQITSGDFVYPRLEKKTVELNKTKLPTDDEIRNELQFCSSLAIRTAVELGLIKANNQENTNYPCKVNPYSEHLLSEKKRKNEKPISTSLVSLSPKFLQNIKLKNYHGKIVGKKITETSPYVEIKCHESSPIIVKKTSLCWLLGSEQQKLSNDRLRRVQHPIKWKNAQNQVQQNHVFRSKPLYDFKSFKSKKKICKQ